MTTAPYRGVAARYIPVARPTENFPAAIRAAMAAHDLYAVADLAATLNRHHLMPARMSDHPEDPLAAVLATAEAGVLLDSTGRVRKALGERYARNRDALEAALAAAGTRSPDPAWLPTFGTAFGIQDPATELEAAGWSLWPRASSAVTVVVLADTPAHDVIFGVGADASPEGAA